MESLADATAHLRESRGGGGGPGGDCDSRRCVIL